MSALVTSDADPRFRAAVTEALARIIAKGARAAVADLA
jgi:hypothetical protein